LFVHGGRSAKHAYPIESCYVMEVKAKSLHWKRVHPGRVTAQGEGKDHGNLLQSQARKRQFVRRGHTICNVPGQPRRLVMFGGRMDSGEEGKICSELMIIEVNPEMGTYMILPHSAIGAPPHPRIYHSAAILQNFLLIFGGLGRKGEVLNDLHLLHIGPMIWTKMSTPVDTEASGVIWPTPRLGHAAVTVNSAKGPCVLVFGGQQGERGGDAPLNDVFCLAFSKDVGTGAEAAYEAFSTYSDGAVLSMWDRLYTNLSTLEHSQMQAISKQSEQNESANNKMMETENTLMAEENAAAVAERAANAAEKASHDVSRELQEAREQARREEEALCEEVQLAKARVDVLRRGLQRAEITAEILELGTLLPPGDVTVHRDDSGGLDLFVSFAKRTGGVEPKDEHVIRRSGAWRGSPVTVEEVELPPGCSEADHMLATRSVRVQAVSHRSIWESAVKKELRLAGRLRHPNLLEYFGVAFEGTTMRIVSEPPLVPLLVELGVRRNSQLEHGQGKGRLHVALDVALALEYLHCRGVAHRRVGVQRVFLRDAPRIMAKLGGLLTSRILARGTREVAMHVAAKGHAPTHRRGHRGSKASVQNYRVSGGEQQEIVVQLQQLQASQELPPAEKADPRAGDVYALGMIMLELFGAEAGKEDPLEGRGAAARRASMADGAAAFSNPAINRIRSRGLRLIIMRCMDKDPVHRISAAVAARALDLAHHDQGSGLTDVFASDQSRDHPLVDADLEAFAQEAEEGEPA